MKKKLFLLAIIAMSNMAYGYREVVIEQIQPRLEKGAYEDLLRTLDEYNRKAGKESNYLNEFLKRDSSKNIDVVAIGQASEIEISDKIGSSNDDGYHSIHDLMENGNNSLKNDGTLENLPFRKEGDIKRFYFGNGNTVNDIKFEEKDKFTETKKEAQNNKNIRYDLEGEYHRILQNNSNSGESSYNPLKITVDDYETKIRGKSQEEVSKFLQDKLKTERNIDTIIENGALYTVDDKGKKWLVIADIEPVSIIENQKTRDDVSTKIFVYKPSSQNGKNSGELLYTKDGSIIIEDKYIYKKDVMIGNKTLDELIKEGKNSSNPLIKEYFTDKESMTNENFENKWVKPFEKDSEFNKAYSNYQKEIEETKEEQKKYTMSDNKYWELNTKITDDIPKKYGFYNSWLASDEEKKWVETLKLVQQNKDLVTKVTAKNFEFRGKGRINGTVDLGGGYNTIKLDENLSGEFGTNIILGAYAKLKNIDVIEVGGQAGSTDTASSSGRTSLSLDIDPNVKNDEGHLVQHAFKDSDKDIIFTSAKAHHPDNRNDFAIELMVSRVNDDSIINMGRELDYEAGYHKFTSETLPDKVKYSINMISDSIAHDLIKLDEKGSDGNTLMKVEIKDNLKLLDKNENAVYKSIKDSGFMGSLHETLTTTNKKTTFSAPEVEAQEKKELKIANYLKTEKSPEELINDISQITLNDKVKTDMVKLINELSNNADVEKARVAQKQFEEWKKEEDILNNSLNTLKGFDANNTLENFDSMSHDEQVNKYNEMKNIYNEKLKPLYDKLYTDEQKLTSSKELVKAFDALDSCFKSWKDEKELENTLKASQNAITKIENLLKDDGSSIDKELSDALKGLENNGNFAYKNLYYAMFYDMRQEESLKELKVLLDQVYETNIYSKLNKVTKDEMNIYTYLPFNLKHDFKTNEKFVGGGGISTRNSMDGYKGNIYTGYGLYEKKYNDNMNFGFMIGGATSNHEEIKNDSLDKTTTESKIKGVSAYLGGYTRHDLKNNFEWINGVGLGYGQYEVTRDFRNTYQRENFTSDIDTMSLNTYSGLIYKYNFNDTLAVNLRGVLSYTFINQGDIKEKEKPLSLDIKAQNYNYIDGETGVSLTKTIFGSGYHSAISGGIYSIINLAGAENDNMKGKFHGSTSSFDIKGHDYDKTSLKMFLDYNFYKDSGFNYGIEGSYTKTGEEDNITIGVKAGYYF